jgi:pyruvate/oxaloacetate carboxyltransferase
MYTDFAATVVADGKILAALNDAIQPKITIDAKGEIVEKTFKATKRVLKGEYGMAPVKIDNDKNGVTKEWFEQSAEFSKFVVGKTAAEVADMATKVVEGSGYVISADDALLTAGCTIQITGIKAVVAKAATNAR